ncbi:hypothetical protein [Aliiroseovarius sp. S253]|uniref:hypothetical protein n=1 Tax=Aliiroseovarius sp. S253 TaxID=3415133 RepID=UPI003C7A945C
MNSPRIMTAALAGAVLTVAAACTPTQTLEDPCAAADRPVTLENLLENSFASAYEACLAEVRDEAVKELEN